MCMQEISCFSLITVQFFMKETVFLYTLPLAGVCKGDVSVEVPGDCPLSYWGRYGISLPGAKIVTMQGVKLTYHLYIADM